MVDNTKDRFELPILAASGSSSDDERLPLYEEQAGLDRSTIPSEEASAAEVRGFIYQYLNTQSGLDQTAARNISEKWTIGTGAELRTYPFTMYIDIFGAEPAWTIYRYVRTLVLKEREPAKQKRLLLLHLGCGGTIAIFLVASIICGVTHHFLAAWFLAFPTLVIILPFYGIFAFELSRSSQKVIEGELQAAQHDRGKK